MKILLQNTSNFRGDYQNGLPMDLQIIGRPYSEDQIFAFAKKLEHKIESWRSYRPSQWKPWPFTLAV